MRDCWRSLLRWVFLGLNNQAILVFGTTQLNGLSIKFAVGWGDLVATFAGSALMGAVVYGRELYNFLKPRRIGVYGPTQVGKTTLDHFMRTPGEMDDIEKGRCTRSGCWRRICSS